MPLNNTPRARDDLDLAAEARNWQKTHSSQEPNDESCNSGSSGTARDTSVQANYKKVVGKNCHISIPRTIIEYFKGLKEFHDYIKITPNLYFSESILQVFLKQKNSWIGILGTTNSQIHWRTFSIYLRMLLLTVSPHENYLIYFLIYLEDFLTAKPNN